MIAARPPVRIDFAGGTTDISPFSDEEGVCCGRKVQ